MAEKIIYIARNISLRQDVLYLVEGECLLRNNGERGFSLTINQIILEYFENRTPKGIAVSKETIDGKPALTVEESQA